MATYLEELAKNKYIPNIVIFYAGVYIAMRQPDSGLVVDSQYVGLISRVSINPTSIDPIRPGMAFNSSSFTLLDRNFAITGLFANQNGFRTGQEVRIWIGRSGVGMAFSDYLEVPRSIANKIQKVENSYSFSTIERRDRINNGSFNKQTKIAVDILANTTTITVADASKLGNTGFVKIGEEFISYTNITGNDLEDCTRGEYGSTPAAHKAGTSVYEVTPISSRNPIDFLLQLLISSGGGGTYDVLPEGAGFLESLIDVDQFEEIRDEFFTDYMFDFKLWGIESLQTFLENELFYPLGIRLRTNNNSKIGLAVLNRNIFEIDSPTLDHTNLSNKNPQWSVNDDKVQNRIRIFWNWNDGLNQFDSTYEGEDADSIAEFGAKEFFEMRFKGPKDESIVESIANLFLARFAFPRPEIQVDALNSTSYLNIGDKTELFSNLIPNDQGELDFASTLEVIKKSYDPTNGTVQFQLSFTSFSGLRQCIIAPSDTIPTFVNQKTVNLATGRGVYYRKGWKMKLYNNSDREYASSQVNEIASIVGDQITFVDDWSTTLVNSQFRIMFADYDDVVEQQKKFCFISDGTNKFSDDTNPYQVTFS